MSLNRSNTVKWLPSSIVSISFAGWLNTIGWRDNIRIRTHKRRDYDALVVAPFLGKKFDLDKHKQIRYTAAQFCHFRESGYSFNWTTHTPHRIHPSLSRTVQTFRLQQSKRGNHSRIENWRARATAHIKQHQQRPLLPVSHCLFSVVSARDGYGCIRQRSFLRNGLSYSVFGDHDSG